MTPQDTVTALVDVILAQGRKASSGEPLFFDRFNLERVIAAVLLPAGVPAAPQRNETDNSRKP